MCVYEIDTANKSNRDNNTQFYITTSGDEKNKILLKITIYVILKGGIP